MPDSSDRERRPKIPTSTEAEDLETERVRAVLEARLGLGGIAPATRIGRYLVLDRVGSGAMGVVYRGFDDALDRPVAIKVLLAEVDSPALRERLLREARAMARLSHPNVATVYEGAEHNGRMYVAMELIRGRTLRQWQAEARPSWREIVRAYIQAAQGLAAAHGAELVHRDFKPDNAMIDDRGRVKVLDFGLARGPGGLPDRTFDSMPVGTPADWEATPLTRTGALVGTPAYMAPELLEGGEADARSDQFAFCVALHEALFGERPFRGKDPRALAAAIRAGVPSSTRGDVPAWLRRRIARGLAASPADRWPSMDALADALRRDPARARAVVVTLLAVAFGCVAVWLWLRFAHARAIAACEERGDAIAQEWNPAVAEGVARAFAASGLGFAGRSAEDASRRIDAHVESWRAVATEACRRHEIEGRWSNDTVARARWCLDDRRSRLRSLLSRLADPTPKTIANAITNAAALESPEPCLDVALLDRLPMPSEEQRADVAGLRDQLVRSAALREGPEAEAAKAEVEQVLAQAETLAWPPLVAQATSIRGQLRQRLADYKGAASDHVAAYFQAAGADAWEVAFQSASALVSLHADQVPDDTAAMQWSQHAELARQQLGDPDAMRRSHLLEHVGRAHFRAGRFAEARHAMEEAITLREAAVGPDHPDMASVLAGAAIVRGELGDVVEARALLTRTQALQSTIHGEDHPLVAAVLFTLSTLQAQSGEYDAAEASLLRSIAISEAAYGPNHPEVGQSLSNLGFLYYRLEREAEAKPILERALAIREAAVGPDHPSLSSTLNTLAAVHSVAGRTADALALYQRAMRNTKAALGPDHPEVAYTLVNFAAVQYASGDREGGLETYAEAMRILEAAFGPDHPEVAEILAQLARGHAELGKRDLGRVEIARAVAIYDREPGAQEAEGDARFTHAEMLDDPVEACRQAKLARDDFAAAGPGRAVALAAVERWLTRCP